MSGCVVLSCQRGLNHDTRSCAWDRLTPCSCRGWGQPGWGAALRKRPWWCWDSKQNTIQQCDLVVKKASSALGCIKRGLAKRVREVIASPSSSLVRQLYPTVSIVGASSSSVLVLTGRELTFFLAARRVLCFVSVPETLLVTQQCFGYC